MDLQLVRQIRRDTSTIGQLSVNGRTQCFILEDVDRGLKQSMSTTEILNKKIHGKTAIPAGRYQVVMSFSDRFKKRLPLLLNVPGFAGVRIHSGNKPEDTEGCLLTGKTQEKDFVADSRKAYEELAPKIESALKTEKVFITIQ